MSLTLNFGSDTSSAQQTTSTTVKSKVVTFDSLVTPVTPCADELDISNVLRPEDVIYEAESPDEAALVYCAKERVKNFSCRGQFSCT